MARRLVISALVLWAGAALAYGTLRLVYGARPADVNVRWSASVDAAYRRQLETKYSLAGGMPREGTTWSYSLTDLSRANVRALVLDPLVEDTHQINRTRYTIWRTATRGPYVGAEGSRTPQALEGLTIVLLVLGAFPAGLAILERLPAPGFVRARLRPVATPFVSPAAALAASHQWIVRRVPPATPEAVAVFRVTFGLGVVALVGLSPVSAAFVTAGPTSNPMTTLQRDIMGLFVAAPTAADWLTTWVAVWGALFVAGAAARLSFAMLAGGVVGWAVLFTTRSGAHSISALMLTLICLLPSRWGDAWSVDAALRAGRGTPRSRGADAIYGYTIWMPGVVLGVTLFAAAVAKLRESGLGWILNGTVKYHFLTHSREALVDWGSWIGRHPWVAVTLSFAAIALEAGVIVGALSRTYAYRALAGVGALAILIGFLLLQGLFWPAWWLLLLSFLPWHLIRGSSVPGFDPSTSQGAGLLRAGRLQAAHAAIVIAVMVQQVIASTLKLEVNPFVSEYEMYATSYFSPEDYARNIGMTYRIVARSEEGFTASCDIDRTEAEALSDPNPGAPTRQLVDRILDGCVEDPARFGSVSVEGRRMAIDWRDWRRDDDITVPLAGPIPLRSR
jgi:hypothetical protein